MSFFYSSGPQAHISLVDVHMLGLAFTLNETKTFCRVLLTRSCKGLAAHLAAWLMANVLSEQSCDAVMRYAPSDEKATCAIARTCAAMRSTGGRWVSGWLRMSHSITSPAVLQVASSQLLWLSRSAHVMAACGLMIVFLHVAVRASHTETRVPPTVITAASCTHTLTMPCPALPSSVMSTCVGRIGGRTCASQSMSQFGFDNVMYIYMYMYKFVCMYLYIRVYEYAFLFLFIYLTTLL
jgi:hypothetical protein